MKLSGTFCKARFIRRPNRFLSYIRLEESNQEVEAHVPDPGRLKELFIHEAELIVREENKKDRKTAFTVVGVKTGEIWVNIESTFTNRIFEEEYEKLSVFNDYKIEKAEFTFGSSRFDFLMKNKKTNKEVLVEIKGATLVNEGLALFPDAPTTRGTKHLRGLKEALEYGYEAFIIFIIKREDATSFSPNRETDPLFSQELLIAKEKGVKIYAFNCYYDPIERKEIRILGEVSTNI
ncbi:MAG: DNA/RNA nuclease SfsA [Candidatus Heimdallarchaeota archaeon]|nr:DNA/RNA nuclease SfsA [Candidatus Heimdallarchaeota archaeon]MCK4877863.1 DNA/RNA nuclease SfsA [Candidatus Heimdallarchaeota archaeon]